ncbi:MAG TPA: glycosyltransferase family 87 protein [Flavilitoribacter sp.]|nr:glycosyltransferase family 87 protein [Flavilitoribacter sp.]HMQ87727.1 glycosyltransferase family 87 protein [Flavilitoribacter sp.]
MATLSDKYRFDDYGLAGALMFLLLGWYFLIRSGDQPLGDFANYYYAGRMLAEGRFNQDAYDPYQFNKMISERTEESVFVNFTPVPPASSVFYLPFSLIRNPRQAKMLFSFLGLIFFAMVYYRFLRHKDMHRKLPLIFIPLVFYTPLQNNILQGQSYLYLLACLLEGYRQWEKKKPVWAGMLWAVPIALKIYPGILILSLFFQKGRSVLIAVIGFTALFSLSPFLVTDAAVTTDYFTHILPRLLKGEINDPFSHFHQSVSALLNKLLVFDQHLNPAAGHHKSLLSVGLNWIYQISLLGALLHLWSGQGSSRFFRFSVSFLGAFLLVSYGSTYSLMLLLPLYLALVLMPGVNNLTRVALILLIAAASNIPIYLLGEMPVLVQFPRLFAMLGLFFGLVWLIRPRIEGKVIVFTSLVILFKGLALDFPRKAEGDYYLKDNRYGIIHSYEFKDRSLYLRHLNRDGILESAVPVRDTIWQDADLTTCDNQIYFRNKPITRSPGKKQQPCRLNGDEVIFLSDEKRGVGFYTLRRMVLPPIDQVINIIAPENVPN